MSFSMTRGDTYNLTIALKNPDDTLLILDPLDKLYFTLKKDTDTSEIIVQKILTSDQRTITLHPTDTKDLAYGTYLFDIELRKGTGEIYTIVKPKALEITKEVTFYG
jgi:hypothetical protein